MSDSGKHSARPACPVWIAGLISGLLLAACSTLGGKPAPDVSDSDPAALNMVADLKRQNAELQAFKGIGNVKLQRKNMARVQERMAWVGAVPSRLSVVVFTSGRPALKMATNGKRLYLLDIYNPKRAYYESAALNFALKRLIAVPLKPADLVTLLSGRIPVADYRSARLQPDPGGPGILIELKKGTTVLQKIYLDQDGADVLKFEMFTHRGELLYRAEFDAYRPVQDYRVPFVMQISDNDGNWMHLAIDRYMADVEVDPSMFVLQPPQTQ